MPDLSSGGVVSGGAQGANYSVIAPIADHLSNSGTSGLSYQYALNDMVGASGTFSNLHYPNQSQVPGLFDSSSQAGLAFYSHRVARGQYVGVTYQYQRLLVLSDDGQTTRRKHTRRCSSTPTLRLRRDSRSHSSVARNTRTLFEPPAPATTVADRQTRSWTPAGGASLGWQGKLNSFALSYTHMIAGG